DDFDFDQANINSWMPTNEMLNFSTKIYKDNLLAKIARTNILKEQLQNSEIKYEAPTIDKRIWRFMSLQAKETNKLLSKI
ncbi:41868_t:CDS:1, partial [Gigaspora margarita]